MSETDVCFICQKSAFKRCKKCGEVSYCESHEKFHNNDELLGCFPFKVDCLEGVGRVIKASRDIAAGEEIFREKEMVIGPSRSIPPVCLGCGRRVNGLVRCTGCRWPLCNLSCSELDLHTAEECKIRREHSQLGCSDRKLQFLSGLFENKLSSFQKYLASSSRK